MSFLFDEHLGYNSTKKPEEAYLVVRFDVSSNYATRILVFLMKRNIISYEPKFEVLMYNTGDIFNPASFEPVEGEPPKDKRITETVYVDLSRPVPDFAIVANYTLPPSTKIDSTTYNAFKSGVEKSAEKKTVLEVLSANEVRGDMVSGPREREDQSKNITRVGVEPKPNMVSGPKQREDQSKNIPRVGFEPKPVDLPSKVPPVIDPNLKTPVVRSKPVLDLGSSELTSPFLAPDPAPAQRARTPKIDPTTGLTYNLVFDWPSNWADREGRLPNETIYPYDISEINLHSKSAMVGQIGPIGKNVQCSENAKYGNDNFNTKFSLCMNG